MSPGRDLPHATGAGAICTSGAIAVHVKITITDVGSRVQSLTVVVLFF